MMISLEFWRHQLPFLKMLMIEFLMNFFSIDSLILQYFRIYLHWLSDGLFSKSKLKTFNQCFNHEDIIWYEMYWMQSSGIALWWIERRSLLSKMWICHWWKISDHLHSRDAAAFTSGGLEVMMKMDGNSAIIMAIL